MYCNLSCIYSISTISQLLYSPTPPLSACLFSCPAFLRMPPILCCLQPHVEVKYRHVGSLSLASKQGKQLLAGLLKTSIPPQRYTGHVAHSSWKCQISLCSSCLGKHVWAKGIRKNKELTSDLADPWATHRRRQTGAEVYLYGQLPIYPVSLKST